MKHTYYLASRKEVLILQEVLKSIFNEISFDANDYNELRIEIKDKMTFVEQRLILNMDYMNN
jgi:ATP-dependent protease HslVU (ClpYQ) ATPase subunit